MKRKLVEGIFWGTVMGAAFTAGLIGISGFGVLLTMAFAGIAGIIRVKLLTWSSGQPRVQTCNLDTRAHSYRPAQSSGA